MRLDGCTRDGDERSTVAGVREAAVDVELAGFRIPADTIVVWSPYLAGGADGVAMPRTGETPT